MAKVMHLIDTGGPGGAETIFSQLTCFDGGGRFEFLPIVPREGWLSGNLRSLGRPPMILPSRGSLHLSYLLALHRIARTNDVRLIQTHLFGSAVYGALLGLLTGIPVVATLHGPTDLRGRGKLNFVKRWLLARRHVELVAVSTSTRQALIDFGAKPDRIHLFQNGVDTSLYSPGQADDLRAELTLKPGDILIGAVGNIRSPKAYDVLLKAAAQVLQRVPNAFFVVIGEGNAEQLRPLRELQDRLGLQQRFRFLGFRKSTSALYRNFDIFVSSSSSEGLSLSFLEAMATGRAIVATRSGGPQDALADGENGLLAPVGDPAALAQALATAAADNAFRVRLGAAARAHAESNFSLNANLAKYQDIYCRLLDRRITTSR